MPNLYASHFQDRAAGAASVVPAALAAATAYLDGKPARTSGNKITSAQRDADFWSCDAWREVPAQTWRSSVMTLALARYFTQEQTSNAELINGIATACPDVLLKAVRYSGLVLRPAPARRAELDRLAARHAEIAELRRVLYVFAQAQRDREQALEALRYRFAAVSPFELLIQASLYAFEHLVPAGMSSPRRDDSTTSNEQRTWDAINDIFLWKLGTASADDFQLAQAVMGSALARHLAPALNGASMTRDAGQPMRHAFRALVDAQIELNEFVSRSADAFSYDEGIRFIRHGTALEIVEVDAALRAAWWRDGRKLARLDEYWFYRGLDAFALSGTATQTIGRPENHEANRLASIRALRTRLRLTHVYGIAETVTTDAGDDVDVFQALLSLELMSSFFQRDFLQAFDSYHRASGDWRVALRRLVKGGVRVGLQNRLPLTWSERDAKIANITAWTVNAAFPSGNPAMAAAILDFWTSDWAVLSAQLRASPSALHPALLERPILKFGQLLLQLPWHVGLQNNSTAAINNLRRLGQRREQALAETRRIETGLGEALEARGFAVVLNWMPDRETHGDAGEVDLVCALDGVILVMEVKSTFVRMSQKEAFLHATTTLRKAGDQVQRKVVAVKREVASASALAHGLRLAPSDVPPVIHGWIVDTSIECDHRRFGGFLKVSLEEVLIALRDDVELLHDPGNLFQSDPARPVGDPDRRPRAQTLYPAGFTAQRFVDAIEAEAVWAEI